MKIAGYQPSVDLNTIKGAVKVSNDANAYGSGGQGLAALGKAAGQVAVMIEQKQEDDDKQSILNAMDLFNKGRYNIMYNDENGLMNTKLESTSGAGENYTQQIYKLRQDVMGNTKLHSRKNQQALEHLMFQSAQQGYQTVDQYEQKQKEAVTDLRYDNNIENQCEFVVKNYNNPQALEDAINLTALTTSMVYGNRGTEFVESKSRDKIGKVVVSAIDAQITNEDYTGAKKTMDKYGGFLNANQRGNINKVIYQKESNARDRKVAKDLFAKYGGDEQAVRAALTNAEGFSSDNKGATNDVVGKVRNLEGKIAYVAEDGTNCMRTLGMALDGTPYAGQINVDQAIATAKANGQLMLPDNYTPKAGDIAVVENGNHAVMVTEKGGTIQNGKSHNGVYESDLSPKEMFGKVDYYIRTSDYAKTSADGNAQHKPMSEDEQDRIINLYRQEVAADKRIKQYNDKKIFDGVKQSLFSMLQNGTSYADALAWATNQAGGDADKYVSYRNAVTAIYGSKNAGNKNGTGGGSTGKLGDNGKQILIDMLTSGKIKTYSEFMAIAKMNNASQKEMDDMDKVWNNWLHGTGEFAFDIKNIVKETLSKNPTPEQIDGLTKYGQQWVRIYQQQHNGNTPDELELREALAKAVTTKVIGKYVTKPGWLWDDTKQIEASDADLARVGIASVENIGGDWYNVTWIDGTSGKVNGGYVDKLLQGGR